MFPLDAQNTLRDDGFLDLHDARAGELVSEMERRGFPYLSPYGLNFCKKYILDDPCIRETTESLLGRCSLGHWLRYKALPGHIECFRKGGKEAGLRTLVVQQFAKGSQLAVYCGSHLHDLPTQEGIRSLEEATKADLENVGCFATEKDFPNGGLVIRDGRLHAEIKKGYAITFIFATDDALAGWPKILLPNSPELLRMVVKMETPKIRINFAIETTKNLIASTDISDRYSPGST